MTFQQTIELNTHDEGEMHDLTPQVQAIVAHAKVKIGLAHVFNIGSTAAIGTIEFEPGLVKDLPHEMHRLLPPGEHYGHEQTWHDGNGHSHLHATILGPEITVPIRDGELILGTWQQIFHLECDNKPRHRKVVVTVMGD
jgi:secondary thiamine-phosphate synthase enzyme